MFEVHLYDYYHHGFNIKMDEDFAQHYCMLRNIIIQFFSTISPPTPHQTQQDTLSLDDVNHNL